MDVCNAMLALGGDRGNTVPKYGITAAEIAVLQAIHGDEAVTDIEVIGDVERSNRDELARLRQAYGRARPEGSDVSHVDTLFPGAAARVFDTVDELELDEIFFKAEKRAVPEAKASEKTADASGKSKKGKGKAAASQTESSGTDDVNDDGVQDIGDEHSEDNKIFG
ncbi:hypothetical protein [Ochrobactrum sp. A-1]|uniref:hypothetical protein n=1 Tax=Ochrobactrum sp. A-1 TaxID=2920940 RepID=UPI001F0B51DA|nr:hypothetical protein [Ochrobactrum sp. A-1]